MIISKQVHGYEGTYEAHSDGSIWTCKGKTTFSLRNGKKVKRIWKPRALKPKRSKRSRSKHEDEHVELYKDGKHETKLVSRLIAEAFIANPNNLPCVNHLDGDTLNNKPSNLEWCTYKENVVHAFANDLNNHKIKISLVDDKGFVNHFYSLTQASKFIGKNNGYLSGLLKRKPEIKKVEGYLIM